MQHCQFFRKSKIKKGKFTHLGGSSVKGRLVEGQYLRGYRRPLRIVKIKEIYAYVFIGVRCYVLFSLFLIFITFNFYLLFTFPTHI